MPPSATTPAPPEKRFQVVRQLSAAIHGAGVHGDEHAAGGQEPDAASLKVEPCQVGLQHQTGLASEVRHMRITHKVR
jgi:hypothetical protein